MFRVELSRDAERFFAEAERSLARKLARCFRQLEQEPRRHRNITPLKGDLAGLFRFRVGDYRVIYAIDDQRQVVEVSKIAHRREAYR
jgi:mRNA interferase RelE/StbE